MTEKKDTVSFLAKTMSEIEKAPSSVPTRKGMSLKEFVNDNDKLLTAMGAREHLPHYFPRSRTEKC